MEKVVQVQQQPPIVEKLIPEAKPKNKKFAYIGIGVIVVAAGIATGWLLAGGSQNKSSSTNPQIKSTKSVTQSSNEAGVSDESTFKDSAEGTLVEGGIDGEGTHHLEREGGPSKYVYLFSTVIDLSSFKGKKVQVWGATLSGKKAGWLMDVGKIKVIQ